MTKFRIALVFGVAGALAGFAVYAFAGPAIGKGWGYIPIAAAFGAALAALVLWPLFTRHSLTKIRGAFAGTSIVIVAYPLTWYLLLCALWLLSLARPGKSDMVPPWTAVPASLVYGVFGLALTGWFTVPVGCLAGVLLAMRTAREAGVAPILPHVLEGEAHD